MKLAILGTGNMAEAMIAGVLSRRILRPSQIIGFDVNRQRLQFIRKKCRIATARSAAEAVQKTDTILLSVKPQQMKELLVQIRPALSKHHLILSIAAGLDIRFFEKHLGRDMRIVRLMPNTPALLGLGATVYFANRNCGALDKKRTRTLFSAVGIACKVGKERLLDAVTGLSGSGPAFIYRFAEALVRGGIKAGLPAALSQKLAIQTLLGASTLLAESGEEPATLVKKVASKGGTTEAGLKVLKRKKFESIVGQCIATAAQRARALRG